MTNPETELLEGMETIEAKSYTNKLLEIKTTLDGLFKHISDKNRTNDFILKIGEAIGSLDTSIKIIEANKKPDFYILFSANKEKLSNLQNTFDKMEEHPYQDVVNIFFTNTATKNFSGWVASKLEIFNINEQVAKQ